MPKGKVSFIVSDRKFGFIQPEDGSEKVHFNFRGNPDSVQTVGVEVEYVLGPRESGKSPHATRVELPGVLPPDLINATPVPTLSASPPTAVAPKDGAQLLRVSWRFDPPIEQENLILVGTRIRFLYSNSEPALGVSVTLQKEINQATTDVLTPAKKTTPNEEGWAYFSVYLEPAILVCNFAAKAGGNIYTAQWQKETPKVETPTDSPTAAPEPPTEPTTEPMPAEPAPKLEAEKVGPDGEGVYLYRIQTNPKATVTPKGTFPIEAKRPDDQQWAAGPFTADDNGNLELCVRGKNPGTSGEVYFETRGLRSKPRFTERRS